MGRKWTFLMQKESMEVICEKCISLYKVKPPFSQMKLKGVISQVIVRVNVYVTVR